eukprot:GHVR01002758.1.p1 GENE.GHVR01002758.1~~GHVR01002758.1.p1  ORF type:complete len:168 (-),score=14.68 GHVR01002758.1:214-717(-)
MIRWLPIKPLRRGIWCLGPQAREHKFAHPWKGPYTVFERIGDVNYKIQPVSGGSSVIVHVDHLKQCLVRTEVVEDESLEPGLEPPQGEGLSIAPDAGGSAVEAPATDLVVLESPVEPDSGLVVSPGPRLNSNVVDSEEDELPSIPQLDPVSPTVNVPVAPPVFTRVG